MKASQLVQIQVCLFVVDMRDSKGLFGYEEYSTMIDNLANFHFTPIKVGLEYVPVYLMIGHT